MTTTPYALNLGPLKKAIKELPSPIGWWKIRTTSGEDGEGSIDCGAYYGHLAEILFSVEEDGGWHLYQAEYCPDRAAPSECPYYTPIRKSLYLNYSDYYFRPKVSYTGKSYFHPDAVRYSSEVWNSLSNIKTFTTWMNCGDRVRVKEGNYYKTYILELVEQQ